MSRAVGEALAKAEKALRVSRCRCDGSAHAPGTSTPEPGGIPVPTCSGWFASCATEHDAWSGRCRGGRRLRPRQLTVNAAHRVVLRLMGNGGIGGRDARTQNQARPPAGGSRWPRHGDVHRPSATGRQHLGRRRPADRFRGIRRPARQGGFLFHGTPGLVVKSFGGKAFADRENIRLIGVDRPGESDRPRRSNTTMSWVSREICRRSRTLSALTRWPWSLSGGGPYVGVRRGHAGLASSPPVSSAAWRPPAGRCHRRRFDGSRFGGRTDTRGRGCSDQNHCRNGDQVCPAHRVTGTRHLRLLSPEGDRRLLLRPGSGDVPRRPAQR